jgi:D-3-phosphoglycerate dehydrogenase
VSSNESAELPTLFFDVAFPDEYRDLIDGRAVAVGPDEGLDTADAVIAGARIAWNAERFASAANLKVISRTGIGYDNVDVPAAAAAGVVVCNAPVAPSVSTAEHTLALMLAITKQLPVQMARSRAGLASTGRGEALELDGRTLGLVALGRISSRVAAAGIALGMRVIAHDPYLGESPVPGVELVDLDTVFTDADVVSLHAPATADTHHLVGAERLAQMRPGAYLINASRGTLIDQEALLAALESGHLGGVALDVTDPEPLPADHPLLARDDVIITPHIASATVAGRRRLYEHAIDNALAILEGRPATVVAPLS